MTVKKLIPLITPKYGTTEGVFKRELNLHSQDEYAMKMYETLEQALKQTVEEKRRYILDKIAEWKFLCGVEEKVEHVLLQIAGDDELLEKITIYSDGSFMNTGLRVRQNSIFFSDLSYRNREEIERVRNSDYFNIDLMEYLHSLGEDEVERLNSLTIYEQMKELLPLHEGYFVQINTEQDYETNENELAGNKNKVKIRSSSFEVMNYTTGKTISELAKKDKDIRYATRMSVLKKREILTQYIKQLFGENNRHANMYGYLLDNIRGNDMLMDRIMFTDNNNYDVCIEMLATTQYLIEYHYDYIHNEERLDDLVHYIRLQTGCSENYIKGTLANPFADSERIKVLMEYLDVIPMNIGYKPFSKY